MRSNGERAVPVVLGAGLGGLFSGLTFPAYQDRLVHPAWRERTLGVGFFLDGVPRALALAEREMGSVTGGKGARLLSIWVDPQERRQGAARALLGRMTQVLQAEGCSSLRVVYRTTLPDLCVWENWLQATAWSQPTLRMLFLETSYAQMAESPFLRLTPPLDPDFTLVPWEEVTEKEIRHLGRHRQFSPEVWPMNYREPYHRASSLGARYRGELVGWVVNHPVRPPLLRFTTSYLRDDLQGRGRFAAVLAESVRRTQGTEFTEAIWSVPVEFPRMLNFARRRLAPYCHRVSESRSAVLSFPVSLSA